MTCRVAFLGICLTSLLAAPLQAQAPEPLRLSIPMEPAWKAMLQVLEKKELRVAESDRVRGTIVTEFKEYSSGPLTESHIAKIGTAPKVSDADWIKVEYQLEIELQLIESRVTLVTAAANIKALKRDFLGAQTSVNIPSNGALETDLLRTFGKDLFGERFELPQPKKGYWQRDPKYLPEQDDRIPKVVGPERPTP